MTGERLVLAHPAIAERPSGSPVSEAGFLTSIVLMVSADLTDYGRDHEDAFGPRIRIKLPSQRQQGRAPPSSHGNGCNSH